MKTKLYTKEQVNKKYKDVYVRFYPSHYDFWNDKTNKFETVYSIVKTSKTIKENMTLGQDVGTELEYKR